MLLRPYPSHWCEISINSVTVSVKKTYFKFSNNLNKRGITISPLSPERSQLDPSINKIKKGVFGLKNEIFG
jgi:hypothetical protein